MKNEIPLSVPLVQGNEWKYIKECLDTGWVSSAGSYVTRFEEIVANYIGARCAVSTVNGTSALHVSLIACDVKAGDEVIVPTLTFIATANAVKYCRAEPIFMDCDPHTLCIDVRKVVAFIENNTIRRKNGFAYNKDSEKRIKAVIPVHVFGHPADMDSLIEVCAAYNIDIVEDATESLGSEYKGRKTASFGRVGCLSFNGNKIITTGGGGMIVTNDESLATRIRHLTTQARTDSIEYDHDEIGYNYRLSNIQAAMGVAQMEKLYEYIKLKRENACFYKELLSEIDGIEFLWEKPWAKSNFWFYTIRVPRDHKKALMGYMFSKGIQVRPVWKPLHGLSMYKSCQAHDIKNAIDAYNTCINLPCSANLKKETIESVVKDVKDFFKSRTTSWALEK